MPASRQSSDNTVSGFPRIIHQTWKTRDLPPFIDECVRSLKETHPAWRYRFHTDDDWHGLLEGNPFIDPADFWSLPTGVQRSDIARMLALYRDGGVYLDVDFITVRSLESLIEAACDGGIVEPQTEILLSTDHPVHCNLLYGGSEPLMNHFIVAKPRSTVIAAYLSRLTDRLRSMQGEENPVITTGPVAFTEIFDGMPDEIAIRASFFPFFWTHPLPDMSRQFAERPAYDEMIRDGSWRSRFCPFFIHCWWHNYYMEHNMIAEYGEILTSQTTLFASAVH